MVDYVIYSFDGREDLLPVELEVSQEFVQKIWDEILDMWDDDEEKPTIVIKMQEKV